MSVICSEIINAMNELAPQNLAESWDNVGLMVGDKNRKINKVLFALDCTEAVLDEAIEIGADMIITHHPFIFRAFKTLDYSKPLTKRIVKAIKNDIVIFSAHTNLDIAEGGTNTTLAELLSLDDTMPLAELDNERTIGIVGRLNNKMCFAELIEYVKDKLGCEALTVCGDLTAEITKIGLCTGSGSDYMAEAAQKGCQAYITGDMGYHDGQQAEELGLCVIDGTHYLTENIVVPKLCEYISNRFDSIECIVSKVNGQTLNIV